MTNRLRIFILLLIVLTIRTTGTGFAGNRLVVKNVGIRWEPSRNVREIQGAGERMLCFKGSTLGEGTGLLPVFLTSVPFDPLRDSVSEIHLRNARYTLVDEADLAGVSGLENLSAEIGVESRIRVIRKHAELGISFVPLRRSGTGGIEQLTSCEVALTIAEQPAAMRPVAASGFADHSVLASGAWYKFAVASDAIYRITYEDLQKAGINAGAINPRNLRICGNGGGMLPEANSARRTDDLRENAIYVSGEEDGRFDPGDYLLFYGEGPDQRYLGKADNLFHCRKNVYSDRMYYFLNFNLGPGKRITPLQSTSKSPTFFVSRFEDYAIYQKDDTNLIKSGREWWDQKMFDITTTRNYAFSFPNIDSQSPVSVNAYVAARSTSGNTRFTVSALGNVLMTLEIEGVSEGFDNIFANTRTGHSTFLSSNPVINITLDYQKSSSSSVGYLNFIELNAVRALAMYGNQLAFRSVASVGTNNVTEFTLNGNGQNLKVWDITDGGNVRLVETTRNGANYIFRLETDTLHEFVAFDGGAFNVPEFHGTVANQDLHGTAQADYIVIAHPAFLGEAERLAEFHRTNNGFSVLVTTPDLVYNEFSSGGQDITAIRDFLKMLYDRAESGKEPRYLLLFGDASYDFKNRTANNTNFVPSYESAESLSPVSSFVTDDYFGLLDASEGQGSNGSLDVGIGRFPVSSIEQATAAVDKVIHYCSQSTSVKNDWRNVITFVGDDQNEGGNLFVEDSEDLARIVEKSHKQYNTDKIYADAYSMVSTPGGARYPEVNDVINKRVEKGSLIMNYVGHGGEVGWAHERILQVPDIQGWRNFNNMPVFVTATCEFSRYDDPDRTSAGEWVFLNPQGGGVALFTTTRLTFASTNKSLLINFYNKAFNKTAGGYLKLGDLLVESKKEMGSTPNIHAFVLLGDPAMKMAYPELNVVTSTINSHPPSTVPDTLKALSEVNITGEIQDQSGQRLSDFSGTVFPTVFDKATEIWTKANTGEYPPVQFYLRKNAVYKGKVEVKDGVFSFSFIVPKDIAYQFGTGKISYYAMNETTDASGYDDRIQVGGYNNSAAQDDNGPEIALFMNDHNFRAGGITGTDPFLLADVSDSSGVNTVGNGIGHDITAVLDGRSSSPMILNDYYVSDLNTYKSGGITYPLNGLSDGPHHLTVKVWDVQNNSSEADIDFVVVSSSQLALEHLITFPNPMKDHTTFAWESNQAEQPVEVKIDIYTVDGRPLKNITTTTWPAGYRNLSVQWDGTQDNGGKISAGLYIYTVELKLADGRVTRQSSRLVVVR